MKLNEFKERMDEGVWVLSEASEQMALYVRKCFPDTFDENIKKYRTPQKFLLVDGKVVVVSVSKQLWAGVDRYDVDDVLFREIRGEVAFLRSANRAERIVSAIDQEVDEDFATAMTATGFLTQEEYERYSDPASQDGLPAIRVMAF